MKTIIAGSREIQNVDIGSVVEESGFVITEVISGGANGIDQLGEQWACEHGIPVRRVLPNWRQFGRAAGPIRNREMAELADALIAVWDGRSRGTRSMIEHAERLGLQIHIYRTDQESPRGTKTSHIHGNAAA